MTTSNQTNNRLTQKDLLGESFYSLISGSWKIKKDLSKASGIIFDYLFEYFCRIHKDKSFFSTDKIMTETGYSFNTVKNSIKELAEKNIFIIREYRANDFVILVNKISNQKFISKYDSGEVVINNASFFSEKSDKKISNFIQKSVKNFQNIGKIFQKSDKNSQTFDKKNQSIVNGDLDVTIDNKELQSFEKQSLDLNIIDHIYIDHHHIDQEGSNQNLKTSFENLSKPIPKNDDDFLKIFESKEEEKSSNEIEVLEEKIEDKNLASKSNEFETAKPDLTNTKNIPQGVGADCGQNVDKENLYKRILAIGVFEKQAKELIEIVKTDILEEYLKAVPYWKKTGKINNIGAFYNASVRNPKPEQLPAELLLEKKQEQKKQETNKLRDFCKYLGLTETFKVSEIKPYISSCKNIFTSKDELAEKIFEQNFNSLINSHGPTEAEKIANHNVRKALNSIDSNRTLLEKTLDYLKINTEITKFNYQNLINKALNKIEIQFAGAI